MKSKTNNLNAARSVNLRVQRPKPQLKKTTNHPPVETRSATSLELAKDFNNERINFCLQN
jgi:hypothetical protein